GRGYAARHRWTAPRWPSIWSGGGRSRRSCRGAGNRRAPSEPASQPSTSRWSVTASAGRPISTARAQVRAIVPAAADRGPPVSQDHSLWTWLSLGIAIPPSCRAGPRPVRAPVPRRLRSAADPLRWPWQAYRGRTLVCVTDATHLRPDSLVVAAGRPPRVPGAPVNPPVVLSSTYVGVDTP